MQHRWYFSGNFTWRGTVSFLPYRVGEGKLLPDPHLFLKFMLFWWSLKKKKSSSVCLDSRWLVKNASMNGTDILLVTRCIYMRNLIVFWLWGLRPPPPPICYVRIGREFVCKNKRNIYNAPRPSGRIWDLRCPEFLIAHVKHFSWSHFRSARSFTVYLYATIIKSIYLDFEGPVWRY